MIRTYLKSVIFNLIIFFKLTHTISFLIHKHLTHESNSLITQANTQYEEQSKLQPK